MFDQLTPIFDDVKKEPKPKRTNPPSTTLKQTPQRPNTNTKKVRKTRWDKKQNIKFPVNQELQRELKRGRKRCLVFHPSYRDELTQTKFNSQLLIFALDNPSIVQWNLQYKDTPTYMHCMVTQPVFEEINGIYGLCDEHNLSIRKCTFMLVISALNHLERKGDYNEIIQQIKLAKR